MTVGMLRQIIKYKQINGDDLHKNHPLPIQQTVFKISKDNLKIILFLMANKTSVLSKLTSVQDLENNNRIIFDPLGNIYEIYILIRL